MLPHNTSCLASVFFHFMTVYFDTVLSSSCLMLILRSVLFVWYSPYKCERGHLELLCLCPSHSAWTSQLPSASKGDFLLRSESSFKIGVLHCDLEQSCLHANAPSWFSFPPKLRGQLVSSKLLRSRIHTVAYTLSAKYRWILQVTERK